MQFPSANTDEHGKKLTTVSAIFSPAIRLMDRLTYPKKFILIGLIFTLPLGLVLFLLVNEINDRTNFDEKELAGNKMLKPLRLVLEDLQRTRGLECAFKAGAPFVSQADVDGSRADIRHDLEKVKTVEKEIRPWMPVSSLSVSFSEDWEAHLQAHLENDASQTDEEDFKEDTRVITDLLKIMTDMADRSNLILDPNLDSYYLMDLVVTRLPALSEQIGQARAWGVAVVSKKTIRPQDAFILSGFVGVILQAQGKVLYGLEVIVRENPSLRPRLESLLDQNVETTNAFLETLKERVLNPDGIEIEPKEYWDAAIAAIDANYRLYDAASTALDEVLQARIDRFSRKKTIVLYFTFFIGLIVVYLVIGFYRATIKTISTLEEISRQMLTGRIASRNILPDVHDEMSRVIKTFAQLTDRLRGEMISSSEAAAKFKESEERLKQITDAVPSAVYCYALDKNGGQKFLFLSGFAETLFGLPSQDMMDDFDLAWNLVLAEDADRLRQAIKISAESLTPWVHEFRIKDTKGNLKWVQGHSIPEKPLEDGALIWNGVFSDVTLRKKAEQWLATQYAVAAVLSGSENLESVMYKIIQIVGENLDWQEGTFWILDTKTDVLRCTDIWYKSPDGMEEFVEATRRITFKRNVGLPGRIWESGKPLWIHDVMQDDNFPRAAAAAKSGLHSAFGFPIICDNQFIGLMEFFSIEIRGLEDNFYEMMSSLGAQIGQHIRERQLREQLLQSQKMNTVGTLAGGIAHDLNNQLTPVRGYIDLLLQQTDPGHPNYQMLTEAGQSAERCSEVIQRLTAFSRPTTQKKTVILLSGMFKEFKSVIEKFLPSTIQVKFSCEKDIWPIEANETEIQTVLMNLAVNARDAMPQGGHLTIEAKNIDLSGKPAEGGG